MALIIIIRINYGIKSVLGIKYKLRYFIRFSLLNKLFESFKYMYTHIMNIISIFLS